MQDLFEHRITFSVFALLKRESTLPNSALERLPQTSVYTRCHPQQRQVVGSALKSIRTVTSHTS